MVEREGWINYDEYLKYFKQVPFLLGNVILKFSPGIDANFIAVGVVPI